MTLRGPERFPISICVQPTHIDELGHVSNLAYLRRVQEVATVHRTTRTTTEQRAAQRPAMPGD